MRELEMMFSLYVRFCLFLFLFITEEMFANLKTIWISLRNCFLYLTLCLVVEKL